MATVFFNLVTRPYAGTHAVKVAIYKNDDPLAEVDSQVKDGPLGQTTWSFPGLDKGDNYFFNILEVDETDHTTVIAIIDSNVYFVPNNDTLEYKDPVVIQVGVSNLPGEGDEVFPSGVNSVTIPDFIGWDIDPERIGAGGPIRGRDYTYDITTGQITLLQEDDVFLYNEYWRFRFLPRIVGSGGASDGGFLFKSKLVVTGNKTLTTSDIGKVILVKPAGNYLEITLPAIATVLEFKATFFQFCQTTQQYSAKVKTAIGEVIAWLKPASSQRSYLYGCPNESFAIYKENDTDNDSQVWRIINPDGNWKRVGERVNEYAVASNVFNKLFLDGGGISGILYRQYARLYDEYVLNLPPGQAVAYSVWSTGNNKYKFSLKSDNTTNARFHIPDLRNLYERMTNGLNKPGDFQDQQVGEFTGTLIIPKEKTSIGPDGVGKIVTGNAGNEPNDSDPIPVTFNTGKENLVKSVIENSYILV